MTRPLHDLLYDSARAPRTEFDVAELWRRGRARRRRKQLGTVVAAVAVLGVVGGVALGDPAVRLAPAPLGDQPTDQTTAPASYDRGVELASDVAPLEGTVVITERFAPPPGARAARDDEVLPPKDGAGENPCCLVVHPSGPALVDGQQRMLRVYPGVHSVGYGRTRLDVVSAAVLDSGAVALLGDRPAGRSLVVLPLAELPDLTQASGPFFEPAVERVDVPDDAGAVAAGRGGFWVHAADGWVRVTDEDGVGIDAAEVADRLVLRDGSAVDAEERADGSAVLHQQAEGFTLRLELTVPDRRVSIQRVEAVDGPAPHTLLVVLRVDGGETLEHRLVGISGDTHVDYGTLAPGDTWTERLAITSSGELYHLHSDDAGVAVTRYNADLTRLAGGEGSDPEAGNAHDLCDQDPMVGDVTGDGRQDRIVHAWNDGAPLLVVCTATGLRDQLEGLGQTELLETIDVEPDGRHEIVYGGTTVSLTLANVAVWVGGRLHSVTDSSGEALELRRGSERQGDRSQNGDEFHDWGCEDFTGDGTRNLVTVAATYLDGELDVTRTAYEFEGSGALVVGQEREMVPTSEDDPSAAIRLPSC